MEDRLFQSLCSKEALYQAWIKVKEKDTAGGIDLQTVHSYAVVADKNIEELLNRLISGNYVQQPYREVFIPKNETEKRRLALLSVNDKIVQTAVSSLITPLIERSFLKVSYAYQNNKGPVKAINQVRHLINNERFTWLVSCDIDNFFDSIPHPPLFNRLTAYLKSPGISELVKMFVTMGRVNHKFQWKDNRKGIPQGGVVSPLLANFYLYPLDKAMIDNGFGFVRYADDFILLTRSREEAEAALSDVIHIITKQLYLSLNEGSEVLPVDKGFEFLGIWFDNGQIALSDRKYKRLVEKMANAAGIGQGLITTKLKETVQGISAFYGKLVPQETLERLDNDLIAILKLRFENLNEGKSRKGLVMNQMQSIQFLSDVNNIYKSKFIQESFGLTGAGNGKNKKPDLGSKILKSRNAVLKRKHEYHKIESSGFDLIISQPGMVLGKKEKSVIVRKNNVVVKEVPFLNLRNITILSEGINISSNLVQACTEQKITIHFLGTDGTPYAQLISSSFFDSKTAIAQIESYRNDKYFYLIRHFVHGKITNQLNLMKYYGKYYMKRNHSFGQAFPQFETEMKKYAKLSIKKEIEEQDEFRLKMFAIEGQASSIYWDMVTLLIKTKVSFTGRERKGATDLVNCMLNYGYGILYARVTEAIVSTRLNPCLSYLHKPEGDRLSLVYDLIEEFRQQTVDRVIIAIIIKHKNLKAENGLLDNYTRKLVAQKVTDRLNNHEKHRNFEMRLSDIIHYQAKALVKYIEGENKDYKPYIPKW